MGQIQGIRTAGGDVKLIKDVGEYDVWSSAIFSQAQNADLYIFSYALGGSIAGAAAVTATKGETNLNVANAFVDESMNVYGIAIQPLRETPSVFQGVALPGPSGAIGHILTLADYLNIEACCHFGFYIGGDKPFAEGKLTWLAEAGGLWGGGNGGTAPAGVLANNVPTAASARVW